MKKEMIMAILFGIAIAIFSFTFVQAGIYDMFITENESEEPIIIPPGPPSEPPPSTIEDYFPGEEAPEGVPSEEGKEEQIGRNQENGVFSFFSFIASIFESDEEENESQEVIPERNEENQKEDFAPERSWVQVLLDSLLGRSQNHTMQEENYTNQTNITIEYDCGNFECEINLGENIENCAVDCL